MPKDKAEKEKKIENEYRVALEKHDALNELFKHVKDKNISPSTAVKKSPYSADCQHQFLQAMFKHATNILTKTPSEAPRLESFPQCRLDK